MVFFGQNYYTINKSFPCGDQESKMAFPQSVFEPGTSQSLGGCSTIWAIGAGWYRRIRNTIKAVGSNPYFTCFSKRQANLILSTTWNQSYIIHEVDSGVILIINLSCVCVVVQKWKMCFLDLDFESRTSCLQGWCSTNWAIMLDAIKSLENTFNG